jgi:hypothetical protein
MHYKRFSKLAEPTGTPVSFGLASPVLATHHMVRAGASKFLPVDADGAEELAVVLT